eukprot:CAMPEP_0116007444 /NCGR_PEP_ID=MMETSP0321-20121206/2302_1 /TAXON_ID=163516 /ORGANISM="Leptocylindrus danicus var. danicus, Strain B650" /LENGTH=296 /DNA_ID=CAMNT_0003476139 /DNA_START=124 /DNA_END=1011 /DNA_ORIENTATION=-
MNNSKHRAYFNGSNDELFNFDAPNVFQNLTLLKKTKTKMSEDDEAWFTRIHPLHFHSREIRALKKRKSGLKRRSADESCGPSLSKSFRSHGVDKENDSRHTVSKARKHTSKHSVRPAQSIQPLGSNANASPAKERQDPSEVLSLMSKYWKEPSSSLTKNTRSREQRINDTKPLVKAKKSNVSSSGPKTYKTDVSRVQKKSIKLSKTPCNEETSDPSSMSNQSVDTRMSGSKRKQELRPPMRVEREKKNNKDHTTRSQTMQCTRSRKFEDNSSIWRWVPPTKMPQCERCKKMGKTDW